jgi:hypothetical protein
MIATNPMVNASITFCVLRGIIDLSITLLGALLMVKGLAGNGKIELTQRAFKGEFGICN